MLTLLYNSINDAGIMNVFVVAVLHVQVPSFYVLIGMKDSIHHAIGILLSPSFVNTVLVTLIVFGKASQVYPLSVKVSQSCIQIITSMQIENSRSFRKVVKSWAKMKIRFFGNNYFDQLTPLVFEQFCFDTTITLLLIGATK